MTLKQTYLSALALVEASYPATAPYAASQSAATPLAAAIGGSALVLSANPASSSSFGDQVVLSANLSPSAPEGVSTNGETITFYNGTTSLGTGTLANGAATLTPNSLPIGTDNLTAVYPGDGGLGTSTSAALVFTVANNAEPLRTSQQRKSRGLIALFVFEHLTIAAKEES